MTKSLKSVAVIIPYFQRTEGPLERALRSVFGQSAREKRKLTVYLVDDQSPVAAETEIAKLPDAWKRDIRVIDRENGGPAAARNTALDAIDPDFDFVAFLDSDDEWMPEHLDNAVTALEPGFDFFFGDFYQLGQRVGAFERAGRLKLQDHPTLRSFDYLHRYAGDMVEQIITGNVIGTSTVVFRRSAAPDLRFRSDLVNAGEDYLFWLDFARSNSNIAFSSMIECKYGPGINIFSSAAWGSELALPRILYELKYRKTIAREFNVSEKIRQHLRLSITKSRREFAAELTHRAIRGKSVQWTTVARIARTDPLAVLSLPLNFARALREKFFGAAG